MEASRNRNRLLLVAAAVLFSTGGAAIKATALTGWQVASLRSGVAAVALLAGLKEARTRWSWRLAPVATAYAATLVLFVLATRLTTAANAIFLQSTAPFYLLLLGPWMLSEPVLRSDVIYALALGTGMTMLLFGTENPMATAPNPQLGNAIGAGSGLAWALTVMGLRWIARRGDGNSAISTVVCGNAIAFLAALPMIFPVTSIEEVDVMVILYLGIVQVGLAYVFVTRAIRHVPAFEATSILLLEPVLNPMWVWLVHGEKPGQWGLAGGAIIVSATLLNARRKGVQEA